MEKENSKLLQMNLVETQKIALEGLSLNKVRSTLTTLGVVIGVAAVILLVGVGEGVRADISNQIEGLGSNLVIVLPGGIKFGQGRQMAGSGALSKLTYELSEKIARRNPRLKVAPLIVQTSSVKFRAENRNIQVTGVTSEYADLRNHHVTRGSFITKNHLDSRKRVCTIGATVVRELFKSTEPLGKSLTIKGAKFKVIGVMEEKGYLMNMDLDKQVFIPLTSAQNLFGVQNLSMIYVQAPSTAETTEAKSDVSRVLKKNLDSEDFNLNTQQEFLETFQAVLGTLTLMLGSIAGISLVVGGIGIMNIMLVSVTERTREIGLRKALGATEESIMLQFLFEAITLSLFGGAIGILLGTVGAVLLDRFTELVPKITPWSVGVAFFFSALVGIFFGVYPAKKAADMDPIVSLRYE